MKIWITEYIDGGPEPELFIGPYIRAESYEAASGIAIQYGLDILGEIKELVHNPKTRRVVH
tara:strand:- start:96 stop:278 length:183 start_codon:yes stop_codon:yes gene_type:complete